MKTNLTDFCKKILLLLVLSLALPVSPVLSNMNEYCASPPFVAQAISPNILIALDNSGSMCDQAYAGQYDPTQFANGLYYGYFDSSKNYKYTGNRWEITSDPMNTGTVTNPIASGDFLNWATMRRTEVSKKLLIGGKADPRVYSPGNTVKLYAETACPTSWNFTKDIDTSSGNLIYPFVGNYGFRNNSGVLVVSARDPATTMIEPPISDISTGGWGITPSTPPTAWDKVADVGNNATYIRNPNNTNPAIFGVSYAGAEPLGDISVTVKIRARKTVDSTRGMRAVLRLDGIDYESPTSNLTTGYVTYSRTWTSNPTGGAWTWDQVKGLTTPGKIDGFGVKAAGNYTASQIRVTQVFLEVTVAPVAGSTYNIQVDQADTRAQGVIDNLDNDVRFGLAYYNTSEGGRIADANTYVGYQSAPHMINSIHSMVPSTWTPLGETLYEMVRYFRQDAPHYSSANFTRGSGNFTNNNVYRDPYAFRFTDVDANLTNMYVHCAKSFILFLTDGESTQDTNVPNIPAGLRGYSAGVMPTPNPSSARFAGTTVGTTYPSSGTDHMIDVAYWARTEDMRPGTETDVPTSWRQSLPGTQNVFLYPIFMFGRGSTLLKDAAIYGGFTDINGNNRPDCTTTPAECYRDSDGDGVIRSDGSDLPLTYFEGDDGYQLEQNIQAAVYDILQRAASSTAVSVLSSSEGSGANLVQSLFYPSRSFVSGPDITWTSDLMNYWYYLDPFIKYAQIREDTVREGSDGVPPEGDFTLLDLQNDFITQFYFDPTQQRTLARLTEDTVGDGKCLNAGDCVTVGQIPIENSKAIWRAGLNLWWTSPASRTVYTSLDGSTLIDFSVTNLTALDDYLGQAANAAAATATINYALGDDLDRLCRETRNPCTTDTNCTGGVNDTCQPTRNRTATLQVCSTSRTACTTSLDCPTGDACVEETHTWKLGDVISSTPRIMGPSPLNNYNVPSPLGYRDRTYADFITSYNYQNRERVFVGANDGMLHAFKLGKVTQTWPGKEWYQPGRLEGPTGSGGIGTESWAYIPKNVLPYLQYLSKPDYCHVYMVDGPVFLTDASIGGCSATDYWECAKQATTWRTVAIGSMGIGGATYDPAATPIDPTDPANCIPTPITVAGDPVGWSSYFALDVTNQDAPVPLWEFNNPGLGVTNVGPAIVKVGGGKSCLTTDALLSNQPCSLDGNCGTGGQCVAANDRWFAILASGSTGPIDNREFRGLSNQNLKLFILDLKTGDLLRTIDTGLTNAFAGSISANSIDLEKSNRNDPENYQDDVVYIGYTQNTTSGGVLRLVINDDDDPANWTVSTVIDNIGPVTTSVVNLLDRVNRKLWLYFAEGRYFHKQDDISNQRRLFGIQEPCYVETSGRYDVLPTCNSEVSFFDLNNQTSTLDALDGTQRGWYITLDPQTADIGAERVISNPTPDTQGAVFFLSFAPTADICGFGGTTFLWAVDYSTGLQVNYTMQGKALVQVSTGEIKEIDLSDPNTLSEKDNRRTVGFPGVPPAGQGVMIITNPTPMDKVMHVQEQ